MSNEWRKIPFNTKYEVNRIGEIRCLKTKYVKKPVINNGYVKMTLAKDGKNYSYRVSRIVALTFLENPDPDNKTEVDHINENKLDNSVENLKWVTKSENMRAHFSKHPGPKKGVCLKFESDDEIIYFASIYESKRHFGKAMGTMWGAVVNSRNQETYRWRGYKITQLTQEEYIQAVQETV